MQNYLPQIETIKTLIELIISSLDYMQNEQIKTNLTNALIPFKTGIVPVVIDTELILKQANKSEVSLNRNQAIKILKNICLNIRLNCVQDSVKHHFDEFVSANDELETLNTFNIAAIDSRH